MQELSKEEFFREVADREGISVNGIVSMGIFYINDKGDLFKRIDNTTSAVVIIKSDKLNCMPDFDSSLNVHWSTIKLLCQKSDKNDFDDAFMIAWYRSTHTNHSQLPDEYMVMDLILGSTIQTNEDQSYIVREDSIYPLQIEGNEFLRFIYLAEKSEKELMHYNGFLHFNLLKPYMDDGLQINCISFYFHINIDELYNVKSPMALIIHRSDFSNSKILCDVPDMNFGFSAFIVNLIANIYHRDLLLECWQDEGSTLFKKQCFANSNVFKDNDLFAYPIPDIDTPIKEIFEEYLTTIVPLMQTVISKDVSIDLLDYEGDRWWYYVYEQEFAMWEFFKVNYLEPYFGKGTVTVISQYVIQFLNYINYKYQLGKIRLAIPVNDKDASISKDITDTDNNISGVSNDHLGAPRREIPLFHKYFRGDLTESQRTNLDREIREACGKEHAAAALASILCNEVYKTTYLSINHVPKTLLFLSLEKTYHPQITSSALSHAMSNFDFLKNNAK